MTSIKDYLPNSRLYSGVANHMKEGLGEGSFWSLRSKFIRRVLTPRELVIPFVAGV